MPIVNNVIAATTLGIMWNLDHIGAALAPEVYQPVARRVGYSIGWWFTLLMVVGGMTMLPGPRLHYRRTPTSLSFGTGPAPPLPTDEHSESTTIASLNNDVTADYDAAGEADSESDHDGRGGAADT